MNRQWLSMLLVVLLFSFSVHAQDFSTRQLFEAVRSNDLEAAKKALKKGASINAADSAGATVLLTAVYFADMPLVQYLVEKGADPHRKGFLSIDGGYLGSVMTAAAAQGKSDVFRFLTENCHVPVTDMDTALNDYGSAWDPLITATYFGHYPIIDYILSRNVDLNKSMLSDGTTPLIMAIRIQDIKTVHYLIDKGADVNLADTVYGWTPLICSVLFYNETDDTAIVKLLLDHGADANLTSNDISYPPVAWALSNNNYRCAIMLAKTTDMNNINAWAPDVLIEGVRKDDYAVVSFLIENGADLHVYDDNGKSLLNLAMLDEDSHFRFDSSRMSMMEYLMSEGLDINGYNKNGSTILLNAIQEMQNGNFVNADEETVDPDDIHWLLDHGADPSLADSVSGQTPLMLSIITNQNLVYNLLIKAGASYNASDKKGARTVHYAVNSGIILLQLLNAGADVNTTDDSLRTPLHYAALAENTDSSIYQILYAYGADFYRKDAAGRAPVDLKPELKSFHPDLFLYPDWNLHNRIIPVLERQPELINSKDKENRTLMHLAAEYGDIKLAEILVKKGISANAVDLYGRTPLFVAVNTGNADMAGWLLNRQADVNIRNREGESPLALARRRGMKEISNMLSEKGAIHQLPVAGKPELVLPVGHSAKITTVALSPDGKYLLSASEDNTIKLWEISSGREVRTYSIGHPVHTIAWVPDGKTFLADFYLLDIETGSTIRHLAEFSGNTVYRIVVFPDGKNALGISSLGEILLWDICTGRVVMKYYNIEHVTDMALSPDGQHFVCGTIRGSILIYNAKEPFPVRTFKLCNKAVRSICFSGDNKTILSASDDKIIRIINASSGDEIRVFKWHDLPCACFSADGKKVISGGKDNLVIIWDIATGQKICEMTGHSNRISDICVTPDNKILTAGWDQKIIQWDPETGTIDKILGGDARKSLSVKISPDGKYLVSSSIDNKLKVWNLETGTSVISLEKHKRWISDFIFSPDGKKVLSLSDDYSIRLWDLKTGSCDTILIGNLSFPDFALYSPDGKYLFADWWKNSMVWNCQSGVTMWSENNLPYDITTVCFSQNSRKIVFASGKYSDEVILAIADVESGRILREFSYPEMPENLIKEKEYNFCYFINDDKYILTGGKLKFYQDEQTKQSNGDVQERVFITLLDEETGNIIKDITIEPGQAGTGYFYCIDHARYTGQDNALHLAMRDNRRIRINTDNLQGEYFSDDYITRDDIVKKISDQPDVIYSASASPGDHFLITSNMDNTIRIWDMPDGKEVATLFLLGNTDWAVKTPAGLFDASPAAMKSMYYSVGTEIIELDQLKSRYYEPALLAKLMGFKEEPIRSTDAFDKLELYPDIRACINDPENPVMLVNLTNRGGGIGKVVVTINGKEIAEDARSPASNPDTETLDLKLDINDHPYLVSGQDNIIEVKAYNADGYLLSRGASVIYRPPAREATKPPSLFILACGVSDYTGEAIDLHYAAKDAENMTYALKTGGNRLFGTEKTWIWQMTSGQADSKLKPYKVNLLAAFNQIAGQAQSQDVLVVYLSGHGINWGGQDGDFYYLTMDAYTGDPDAYNDPEIRRTCTLSSTELTELIKKIPALKQVLIIDACASGKTVENLMAKRDISSSTIRALDRMKDRVGLHIITGCAADAVSYETSRYGQGLLTYSLLEGIKGMALRENRFVDVNMLFDRSQDRVVELAADIGGIQKPEIFSPYGSQSFDIGELNEEDKSTITLAQPKPIFLMSVFQEEVSLDDILGIEQLVDETFLSMSSKGTGTPLIFVYAREYPAAYRIRGQYTVTDDKLSARVNVFRDKERVASFTMDGSKSNLQEFAERIGLKAIEAIK
jgi:WD40 repeat protein/ankyrin repeat protein